MNIAALIITADPAVADGLLRLAAAADAHAEVASGPDEARAAWAWPALVLVGADAAGDVAAAGLPRRGGVVLVAGAASPDAYQTAVRIGAQDVAVLPDHEQWLIDAFAAASEPDGGRATTLCVVGSRGGVGASVLAAALGLIAAGSGLRTLLVDADPLGGGVDLMLGLEGHEGARWPDLAERHGRLNAATLRETLPCTGDLSVLSWRRGESAPIADAAVVSLFDAAVRGFDLVIADVPRFPGDIGRAALRAADATFLLVPAEVRATVAADGLAAVLRRETGDLRLIVQGPSPGGLTPGAVTQALGLPVAGVFERDRRLPAAIEEGALARACRRGPLAEFCSRLLADLSLQPYAHREEAA
ncbi:septum site-determining protein Ssd [Actinomadura opuntiae]|uniref:septum site-determining protein Ssd n=1 Tax=Actinomadura sp. OS1-43 TaxID=604315 RepID=UPI00255B1776|nr:septum site-determining protein Ssd [Actinomadura sp. OS1-43]MDL4818215.1 CpaE-like family protein [Actinomadura sp. OS1-43]